MKKSIFSLLLSLCIITILSTACSGNPPYTEQTGRFDEEDKDSVELKYTQEVGDGFYASLDLLIETGKVVWSIYTPNKELIYEGYVIKRNRKTIKAITYPRKPEIEEYNLESEVDGITFDYLQIVQINNIGEHRLVLKPISAKCKYVMRWYHKLPRK